MRNFSLSPAADLPQSPVRARIRPFRETFDAAPLPLQTPAEAPKLSTALGGIHHQRIESELIGQGAQLALNINIKFFIF